MSLVRPASRAFSGWPRCRPPSPPAVAATMTANSTDWLTLFNLTVDARCNISVTPVNRWSTSDLVSVPATVAASYCTP